LDTDKKNNFVELKIIVYNA